MKTIKKSDYQIRIKELDIVHEFNLDSEKLLKQGMNDDYFLNNRSNLELLLKKVLKWNNKDVSIKNLKFEIYKRYCDNEFYLKIESTDKDLDFAL